MSDLGVYSRKLVSIVHKFTRVGRGRDTFDVLVDILNIVPHSVGWESGL